jgi:hypothetical protein
MNAAAIALAGNDADIIESFVRHHATLVDLLVVVDRASCDGTRAILEALRQEGLPLLIVEDPAPGLLEAARLSQLYRMVATVFGPDLVYLLEPGQFIHGADRATLEAELAHLPPGTCGILPCTSYVPDVAVAAGASPADPLGAITRRLPTPAASGAHAVLRRDPTDDDRLRIDAFGRPLHRADGSPLHAFRAESAVLACFPVRGVAQFTAKVVHEWQAHRAREAGKSDARVRFTWRPALDRLVGGRELAAEDVVQAALALGSVARTNAQPDAALVHDPVPRRHAGLRLSHLARRDAVADILSGVDWPAPPATTRMPATGSRMDLAPLRDLCASLQAGRAVVMALPNWSRSIAQIAPELVLHVPQAGEPDVPVDLVFVPDMPASFAADLAQVVNPSLIGRLAYWPAAQRAAGALGDELELWQRAGWEPDLMRTLAFRALSSYGAGRHAALVLGPVDTGRPERSAAIRETLLAMEAAPHAWADPAPSLIVHPLQAVELEPVPASISAPAPAPAAAATPRPRSVLVIGAGRSGTSCLAGMFDPATHHHARDLYKPEVSNPKGFFEAGHINDLNESMLLMSAVAHLGSESAQALLQGFEPHQLWLARFPDAMPAAWNDTHRREIAKALAATPFCLKDPRMAVTAPAWLEQAPDALLLSIHRPPAVTAESILRECRVATYLLDFRISAKDAFAVWRQAYRRAVKLYRGGADVLFLRYDDLFDADRLARLEAHVRAPLRRQFAERSLNRTQSHMKVPEEIQALEALLDKLAMLSFAGDRVQAHALIDAFLVRWPDQPLPPGMAPADRRAALA